MFIQILDERTIERVQRTRKIRGKRGFFPIHSGFTGNEVTN